MNHDKCKNIASTLKVLAHPQRLYILASLMDTEKTVSEIESLCGASQSVVSQHLTRMRLEKIVDSRKSGNFVYYWIKDPGIVKLIVFLKSQFCHEE
ncbi:MAG: winged helix-turn-helix transcriptional regulator [Candidatus Magnetomorum sp.]|nr:winged helix-turn-helix transcriptional regulator [Candidatus Magnetomorum sp.]